MIGGSGLKKMQDGLNGHQVIRNRVQAMLHGRVEADKSHKGQKPYALLEAYSVIVCILERPWN